MTVVRQRTLLGLVATALLASAPVTGQVAAQDFDPYLRYGGIEDKFNFRGGVLFGSHNTTARLDSEALGVGTEVDLEDALGLSTDTRNARIDGYIRLGKRHQIRAGFISMGRTATFTIDEEIQWGDEVFPVNATVGTTLDLTMVPINWRFAVVRSERVDFGLSLGFFTMFTEVGAAASGSVTGASESSSINVPLPVLGADVDWAIARKLYLVGGIEYFGISIGSISGSWSEFRAGVEYFFLPNVGLGGGYRSINLEVDSTGELGESTDVDTKLFFDYSFKGPQVYLTVSF